MFYLMNAQGVHFSAAIKGVIKKKKTRGIKLSRTSVYLRNTYSDSLLAGFKQWAMCECLQIRNRWKGACKSCSTERN